MNPFILRKVGLWEYYDVSVREYNRDSEKALEPLVSLDSLVLTRVDQLNEASYRDCQWPPERIDSSFYFVSLNSWMDQLIQAIETQSLDSSIFTPPNR